MAQTAVFDRKDAAVLEKGQPQRFNAYNSPHEDLREFIKRAEEAGEILRITLAVAGFTREELEIILKDSQLVVRGRQQEDKSRDYLYRGIAARQFTRTFVLAEGIEVRSANLANGLLAIDLERPEPQRVARTITIGDRKLQP